MDDISGSAGFLLDRQSGTWTKDRLPTLIVGLLAPKVLGTVNCLLYAEPLGVTITEGKCVAP